MPVVATGEPRLLVHALLHHRPLAVCGQDERVQIDLKPVVHRVVVDARREPAGAYQCRAVEAYAVGNLLELGRRVTGMTAATTADVQAELAGTIVEPTLQRAHHRRRDARGMPVHSHHGPIRLEPERIAEAREKR